MPVNITPPVKLSTTLANSGWTDVNVTDYVGGDFGRIAAVVLEGIHFAPSGISEVSNSFITVRKKGSTDSILPTGTVQLQAAESPDGTGSYINGRKQLFMAGCDSNDTFQCYTHNNSVELWLKGYVTIDEGEWLTNAVDVTPTGVDSWENIDVSANFTEASKLVYGFIHGGNILENHGVRASGETTLFLGGFDIIDGLISTFAVPTSGEIFQVQLGNGVGSSNAKVYIQGSIYSNITPVIPAVDYSAGFPADSGFYGIDLSATVPSGNIYGFFTTTQGGGSVQREGLRPSGEPYDPEYMIAHTQLDSLYTKVVPSGNSAVEHSTSASGLINRGLYLVAYGTGIGRQIVGTGYGLNMDSLGAVTNNDTVYGQYLGVGEQVNVFQGGAFNITLAVSGWKDQDFLMAFLWAEAGDSEDINFGAASGWTELYDVADGDGLTQSSCFYKTASINDPSGHVFSGTQSGSADIYGIIAKFRGIDTGDPINASVTNTGNSTQDIFPSYNIDETNTLIVNTAVKNVGSGGEPKIPGYDRVWPEEVGGATYGSYNGFNIWTRHEKNSGVLPETEVSWDLASSSNSITTSVALNTVADNTNRSIMNIDHQLATFVVSESATFNIDTTTDIPIFVPAILNVGFRTEKDLQRIFNVEFSSNTLIISTNTLNLESLQNLNDLSTFNIEQRAMLNQSGQFGVEYISSITPIFKIYNVESNVGIGTLVSQDATFVVDVLAENSLSSPFVIESQNIVSSILVNQTFVLDTVKIVSLNSDFIIDFQGSVGDYLIWILSNRTVEWNQLDRTIIWDQSLRETDWSFTYRRLD